MKLSDHVAVYLDMSRKLNGIGLVALIACAADLTPPSDPAPEVPGPVVTVGKRTYSWNVDSTVVVSVRNPDNAPIYYNACGGFVVQRYRDGWSDGIDPSGYPLGEAACPLRTLSVSDAREVRLSLSNNIFPVSGWYRVVFRLYRDAGLTNPWSERSRASPAFEVLP